MKQRANKLLITGEMRSGTTFLANFLNSQQNMVVYADMLVRLFMEAHALGINDVHHPLSDREKNVLLSNLIQEGKIHDLDFTLIDRSENLTWFGIFVKALEVIDGNSHSAIVGVKRTREEDYLPQLLEAGVKVIYCVRDPRDVVISAQNRFAEFKLFKSVENWNKSVSMALRLQTHQNFYLLRYEDLIMEKEQSSAHLSDFLNIPLTTDLKHLDYGLDRKYQDNSSFGDVSQLFDTKAVNRWKNNAESPEIGFVEKALKHQMVSLNYVVSAGEITGESQALWWQYERQKKKERIVNPLKKIYRSWLK